MQWFATSLLVAMLALLLFSAAYRSAYAWLQWVLAFAEAAAVGAIADWFAVVAMFRHPLGLPIPHTAIIPKNKDRIGEALGRFVEQNFLTPENVLRKVAAQNMAAAIAEWLATPTNSRDVAQSVADSILPILDTLRDEDIRHYFDSAVLPQLDKLDVADIAGKLLGALMERNLHQTLLERMLPLLQELLDNSRHITKIKFGERSRLTSRVFDSYIVDTLMDGMISVISDIASDPQHDLRRRFDQRVREFICRLETSSEYREQCRIVQGELLDCLKEKTNLSKLWNDVKLRISEDLGRERSVIRDHIAGILVTLGKGIQEAPVLQVNINTWMSNAIEELMLRHRHRIAGLIADVIESWDAREVAEKVELQIGRDLQYIRINGTLVGGLVGVGLHALVTLI